MHTIQGKLRRRGESRNKSATQVAQVAATLQQELMSSKRIIRFIVLHDLRQQQQELLEMERGKQVRRFLNLGVLGRQLAIADLCVMVEVQY